MREALFEPLKYKTLLSRGATSTVEAIEKKKLEIRCWTTGTFAKAERWSGTGSIVVDDM